MFYFGFKPGIGYGFYEDNFDDAVSLSEDEWQNLLTEQASGKEIILFDGKVFASEPNIYCIDKVSGLYRKRTENELLELNEINSVVTKTNTALNFLNDTDWKVTRHRDQIAQGIQTSLNDGEYQQLLIDRQNARDSVIRGEKYGNII